MEANNGYLAAIEALGEKLIALRESLIFAGYKQENLETALAAITEERDKLVIENEQLRTKLEEIKAFAKRGREEE